MGGILHRDSLFVAGWLHLVSGDRTGLPSAARFIGVGPDGLAATTIVQLVCPYLALLNSVVQARPRHGQLLANLGGPPPVLAQVAALHPALAATLQGTGGLCPDGPAVADAGEAVFVQPLGDDRRSASCLASLRGRQ